MTEASGGAAGVPWTPHHREGRLAPVQEKEHDRPASLDHPRAPRRPRGNPYFEKYAWLFMRFSGVALVLLALGHLFVGLIWDNGVYRIDFNYVAERWASPFWQIWDMALLWLAMVHGANGMRTIIIAAIIGVSLAGCAQPQRPVAFSQIPQPGPGYAPAYPPIAAQPTPRRTGSPAMNDPPSPLPS